LAARGPAAFIAHHDAPLIGERAATRGRIAMEVGDEHGGAKNTLSVRAPASRTGTPQRPRRDQGRARSSVHSTRPRIRTLVGASQPKLAMGTPV
jgi:hypothetical protein